MLNTSTSAEETRKKILTDHSFVKNLTEEELTKVRQSINIYSGIVTSDPQCAVMSIINWPKEYYSKFYMTAAMCFISRLAFEYEPTAELIIAANDYKEGRLTKEQYDAKCETLRGITKSILRRFIEKSFQFDPDRHVRTAHHLNKQPSAHALRDAFRRQASYQQTKPSVSEIDKKLAQLKSYAATLEHESAELVRISTSIVNLAERLGQHNLSGIVSKHKTTTSEIHKRVQHLSRAMTAGELDIGLSHEPAAELFHNFARFTDANFERLREVMAATYNYTSDIEYSVIFHSAFAGPDCEEKAKQFCTDHNSEFTTAPDVIPNNGIALLGPFKENRDKIVYYNKKTHLLREITEQNNLDQKLGKDMLYKTVSEKKKLNIAEAGPDAPGLARYETVCSRLHELKEKKGLTQQEQDEYHATLREKEQMEVPEDAIAIDVFTTDGAGFDRTQIYTQAEAPLHLEEDSIYQTHYQPRREEGEPVNVQPR